MCDRHPERARPGVLSPGDALAVGTSDLPMPGVDLAPVTDPEPGDLTVRVAPGPRRDWFSDAAWAWLVEQPWTVTSDSNRIRSRTWPGCCAPRRRARS